MTFKNLIHIVEGGAVLDHWLAAAFAFGGAMQFAFIALPETLAATLAIHFQPFAVPCMKVGVISDTHGLLRPEALAALKGCEKIIHAGDIGKPEVLEHLAAIAPLFVVRGNNDQGVPWADHLPDFLRLDLGGWRTLLVHDIADVPAMLDEGTKLVITGHSHKPLIQWRGETLYLNPGSAGPRRFKLPVTLALLEVFDTAIEPHLVSLLE